MDSSSRPRHIRFFTTAASSPLYAHTLAGDTVQHPPARTLRCSTPTTALQRPPTSPPTRPRHRAAPRVPRSRLVNKRCFRLLWNSLPISQNISRATRRSALCQRIYTTPDSCRRDTGRSLHSRGGTLVSACRSICRHDCPQRAEARRTRQSPPRSTLKLACRGFLYPLSKRQFSTDTRGS